MLTICLKLLSRILVFLVELEEGVPVENQTDTVEVVIVIFVSPRDIAQVVCFDLIELYRELVRMVLRGGKKAQLEPMDLLDIPDEP